MHASHSYTEDGVNLDAEDEFSDFAARVCRETWGASPYVEVHDLARNHFRGPRGVYFRNLPDGYLLDVAPDGVGTKSQIVTAALSQEAAAHDILAMTCSDITRWGGLPLLFTNVLDTAVLGEKGTPTNEHFRHAMLALRDAAKKEGVVLFKGETAELGAGVGADDPEAVTKFNWAGVAVGVQHPDKVITGASLAVGQVVVALREYGFRSNGTSSVRGAFQKKFGDTWWTHERAREKIKQAAAPSVLYDRLLAEAHGWYNAPSFEARFKLHAVVHVSGGGIPGKFGEDILFPLGLSAHLDTLWEPPEIMRLCKEWRGMSDEEAYRVWNGGQGMLVVLEADAVADFVAFASEQGIEARACGEITRTQRGVPELTLRSQYSNDMLHFMPVPR